MRKRTITYMDGAEPRCEIVRNDDDTAQYLEWRWFDARVSHRDWYHANGTVESTCWKGRRNEKFWTNYYPDGSLHSINCRYSTPKLTIHFDNQGRVKQINVYENYDTVDRVITYCDE